ncbi:MAG: 1-deoxy-D-xylulose-5-phosphate reductoisomerase [Oscillospiraceae bacterium]|nr:1-deoxy-D-xylulose-5-phosphate reductoisomerase [Oscillospiraceae bacterium]
MTHDFQNSISLLGATGSIGRQTLDVAEQLNLKVCALSADTSIDLLEEQTRKFRPSIVAVYNDTSAREFKIRVRDLDVRVVSGMDGLIEVACVSGAQTVVTAVVGTIGLLPTLSAIKLGRRIALANKETLVCAGALVMRSAREHNAEIIPVDSEHSALFQCLRGENMHTVKRLILTASGGPFRGMDRVHLENVTPEMALKHPNWVMGKKITIDSSTLMNKGLEIIEAVHLFDIPPDQVEVVIHPESIIHSMVEYCDHSIIAQLSHPDMRLPIQYAITYPSRTAGMTRPLDFSALTSLTFQPPDHAAFPCLSLAFKAAHMKGTACAILNGANEAAVDLFLQGKLSFYGIHDCVQSALENIPHVKSPALEDIIEAGTSAMQWVRNICQK